MWIHSKRESSAVEPKAWLTRPLDEQHCLAREIIQRVVVGDGNAWIEILLRAMGRSLYCSTKSTIPHTQVATVGWRTERFYRVAATRLVDVRTWRRRVELE